ncbi:Mitochondrial carrier protein, putative [Penicillium digitatum PHI26]|uniref:Mitochondrial carrier protein, putative n=1 Tax=Penicillium digitatum (strain PHI26 / CECT 20796) TaxID=1170229 RepID=K9FVY7_PEND2|nr:Mitochondrial carrier protein, putative [Penicillium digitatum PHI26]
MYNTHSDVWVAGAFAAVVVDFIVYPFDTLKTRVQSPDYEKVFKDARTGIVRRNVLFRGLYQGIWSVVFSTIPASGAFFTTYEAVKSIILCLPFTHSLPAPVMHGIASSSGEIASCLMLTPAEVLKQNTQMIHSSQENKAAMWIVLSRFRRHPWRLWNGYTALVGRNLPTTALQFPLFEYVRAHLIDRWRQRKAARNNTDRPLSEHSDQLVERAGLTGIAAAFSGTVAATVTTPIDVIKTRVMLSAGDVSASSQDQSIQAGTRGRGAVFSEARTKINPNKSLFSVGRHIIHYEGIHGLFKGGLIRAGWTTIALGLYLSLYEGGRFYLENRRKERDRVSGRFGKQSDEGEDVV